MSRSEGSCGVHGLEVTVRSATFEPASSARVSDRRQGLIRMRRVTTGSVAWIRYRAP